MLRRDCFCSPETTRPVRVIVRDGFVYDLRYEDTYAPVRRLPGVVPYGRGLFDLIDDALYRADDVDASFDRDYGFRA